MALNPLQKKVLVGECKYRSEKMEVEAAEKLLERGELLPGNLKKYYCLCSKSGFQEKTKKLAKENGMLLIDLETMYREIDG